VKDKVKSSKHLIPKLNKHRSDALNLFMVDYDKAVRFYIDYLFDTELIWFSKDKNNNQIKHILNIKEDKLDCPLFFSIANIKPIINLSARALTCAAKQACGLVSGAIKKRSKKIYVKQDLSSKKKRTRQITKRLNKEIIVKPNPEIIYPDLNSLCVEIQESKTSKKFDAFVRLHDLDQKSKNFYGEILIPFNYHSHSEKLKAKTANQKPMSGIQVSKEMISLRWKLEPGTKKTSGQVRGCDTGINSVATISDKQQSRVDNHGHSLNSILQKIVRCQEGSKGFKKAIAHRDNYINWAINQLNFSDIKQLNVEKISNFRYKKNVSKFLNYMGETKIRSKIIDVLYLSGVQFQEDSSAYRSQRCYKCDYVDSKNRVGKSFSCKNCPFRGDADFNGSKNHEINLPSASWLLRYPKKDRPKKFIWNENGFFNLDGSELIVPDKKKK